MTYGTGILITVKYGSSTEEAPRNIDHTVCLTEEAARQLLHEIVDAVDERTNAITVRFGVRIYEA